MSDAVTFIRRKAVLQRTGLPASTLYELINRDAFPRPVQLSTRAVGWIEAEVNEWIEAKIAERDAA